MDTSPFTLLLDGSLVTKEKLPHFQAAFPDWITRKLEKSSQRRDVQAMEIPVILQLNDLD